MSDLTDFLLARITEDEAAVPSIECPCGEAPTCPLPHCGARVIAECEAKRRIVKLHPRIAGSYLGGDCCTACTAGDEYVPYLPPGEAVPSGDPGEQLWPCPTLRALTLPYADHPEYRAEWRP